MIFAELFIPGTPVAKGRPRFSRRGKFIGTYTPTKTRDFESHVRAEAVLYTNRHRMKPAQGPVSIALQIFMPRPKSHTRAERECIWHWRRPDIDNCEKAILDGLNGVLFEDDAQICHKITTKIYTTDMQEPGVWIRLEELLTTGRAG